MRMVLLLGWFQYVSITFAFFKVAMASASGGSINSAGVFFAMLSNLAFCCSSDAQSFYVWIFVNMIKHRSSFLLVVTTCTKFYLWSHCLFLLSFCRCIGNTPEVEPFACSAFSETNSISSLGCTLNISLHSSGMNIYEYPWSIMAWC